MTENPIGGAIDPFVASHLTVTSLGNVPFREKGISSPGESWQFAGIIIGSPDGQLLCPTSY